MTASRAAVMSAATTAAVISTVFVLIRHGGPTVISATGLGITYFCVLVNLALLVTPGVRR